MYGTLELDREESRAGVRGMEASKQSADTGRFHVLGLLVAASDIFSVGSAAKGGGVHAEHLPFDPAIDGCMEQYFWLR